MEGFVNSYNKLKGVGQIISGLNRYWFHRDRIVKGPLNPEINDLVVFEVLDKPAQPGKLPVACQIVILEIEAGQNALAEKHGTQGAH